MCLSPREMCPTISLSQLSFLPSPVERLLDRPLCQVFPSQSAPQGSSPEFLWLWQPVSALGWGGGVAQLPLRAHDPLRATAYFGAE